MAEKSARENVERDAKFQAERAALIEREKLASGFTDPVLVRINYCDGYPSSIDFERRELRDVNWKQVYTGQSSFMERSDVTAAVEAFDASKKSKEDSEARAEIERKAEFASKSIEARQTGNPVVIARWTTHRCMNGHSFECSFDTATKVVLPDGTTKTHYCCCY